MFKYTFLSGDIKINTPFCTNFNDIKREITQTPECIKSKSTYPNGFTIKSVQYADKIEITTNKELIDNGDGSFSVNL